MASFDVGSVPVFSTGTGVSANPTTATLLAEIDSTQFQTHSPNRTLPYQVTWFIAATTLAQLTLEHCLSTGLGSTALRCEIPALVTVNQTGQYITKHAIQPGDRLRVRVEGSTFTGTACVWISAEPLV